MKLAYTVCTPETKGKYLAYRGEIAEVFSSLKEIGYDGVEAFVRDPRLIDQREFGRQLEKNQLELAVVGTGPIVSEDKLTFTSPDENSRREAILRAKASVDFAAAFGAQVNVGKLRGDIYKAGDPVLSRKLRDEAFKEVCDYALTKNVPITIEPQCRFAVDNLNTTQEAIAWVKEMKLPNLFIMMDVFHMNIEDKSQAASFIDGKELNIHVHFADNNRGIPGTGKIDFVDAVRVLKALGYNRYISMEVEQGQDCYRTAQRSFEYVNRLLQEE
ncbi:MAG TPA: sugar phosphate isomerase/epimerase [Peptococcaceae bacterium]|nr:sugar phosphate isomerase/epimerase [Peptococcaceae bacterium]